MQEAEFVNSKRGGPLLLSDGYLLTLNKRVNNKYYWRCEAMGCTERVLTQENHIKSNSGEHTHPSNMKDVIERKTVAFAKTQSIQEPTKGIKRVFSGAS